jgi:hypothetical protein
MTILTNDAILLGARAVVVTCGACRMRAIPELVVGIVERNPEGDEENAAIVRYLCGTLYCPGSVLGIDVQLPL